MVIEISKSFQICVDADFKEQAENGQVGTARKAQNFEEGEGLGVLKTFVIGKLQLQKTVNKKKMGSSVPIYFQKPTITKDIQFSKREFEESVFFGERSFHEIGIWNWLFQKFCLEVCYLLSEF